MCLRLLRRLDPTESALVRERVLRFAEQPDNAFALIDRFATMRDRMGISVDGLTIEEIDSIKSDLLASGPPDVENPFRSLIGADLAALKIERSLRPRTYGDRPFAEGSPLDRSGAQLKDVLAVGGACLLRGRLSGRLDVSRPAVTRTGVDRRDLDLRPLGY